MSLGLTKPGASVALRHPKTGAILEPIGYVRGKAVWPVLGASSEDPDDPAFTDETQSPGGRRVDEDDEENDEDEEETPPKKRTTAAKGKAKDDDDDDEDDREPTRPERQAARYRTQRNQARQELAQLQEKLRKIEDSDKPQDELLKRDLEEATGQIESLTEVNRIMTAQLAFFKSNTVNWVDPTDAFALAEREGMFDDLIDEDGTVDVRELQRNLKDLAKRKPHLVKKPKASGQDDEDNEEQSSRSSVSPMNNRRGKPKAGLDRAALAKRFPVVRR